MNAENAERIQAWVENDSVNCTSSEKSNPPNLRRKRKATWTQTSRKKARPVLAERHNFTSIVMPRKKVSSIIDPDRTPRASTRDRLTKDAPQWPASPTKQTNTSGSRSDRSTSPTKQSAALRQLSEPIEILSIPENLTDCWPKLVPELQNLVEQVRDVADGFGVVPLRFKSKLRSSSSAFRRDDLFDELRIQFFGDTPTLEDIETLSEAAAKCARRGDSEPSWNCFVQAPLGTAALRGSVHRQEVDFLNITTAQIAPRSLLPSNTYGESVTSKMVDFAFALERDANMEKALSLMEPSAGADVISFNPTEYPPALDMPITVSIETKREGENLDKAKLQLSIWVASHFNKLEALVNTANRSKAQLPFLPLLLVQGPEWRFRVATREKSGKTLIWSDILIGSATTRLGIFKIIAALQILINWSETSYRPWFNSYAIPQWGSQK